MTGAGPVHVCCLALFRSLFSARFTSQPSCSCKMAYMLILTLLPLVLVPHAGLGWVRCLLACFLYLRGFVRVLQKYGLQYGDQELRDSA